MDSSALFCSTSYRTIRQKQEELTLFQGNFDITLYFGSLDGYTQIIPAVNLNWRFISPALTRTLLLWGSLHDVCVSWVRNLGPPHLSHSKLLPLPSHYYPVGRPGALTNHHYQPILPKNCTYALLSSLCFTLMGRCRLAHPLNFCTKTLTVKLLRCLEIHQWKKLFQRK